MSKVIKNEQKGFILGCDNCYWKYEGTEEHCVYRNEEPEEKTCDEYSSSCSSCDDGAEYVYEGECYCSQCIIEKFNVEESTTTYYYLDGKELGSDDDIDEVIRNLSDDIEALE
ncbi:TPA: hypothetical protein ACOTG0_002056 [Clostridium perfringens]|nr:hypothetical protein phiCPD_00060 [Clostridium phage phiCp-D]